MKYRIRTWVDTQPLPNLDVTTGSYRVAIEEARARATDYGWNDVSLIVTGGGRSFKGDELEALVRRFDASEPNPHGAHP